jgi:hypothetical protein
VVSIHYIIRLPSVVGLFSVELCNVEIQYLYAILLGFGISSRLHSYMCPINVLLVGIGMIPPIIVITWCSTEFFILTCPSLPSDYF